ncbi:MAG TPA: YdjY domain-containing protein, partial [Tepidisphaeraceae bacterium]|nr:YdjY domain-containing protein [Tepidisphaeraceae bacterium]
MRTLTIVVLLLFVTLATAAPPPASQPVGKLPYIEVDAKKKQVRVECEALHVVAPLEFFCCVTGTNEHESVLRSKVKPSHLHLAMLMIGLEPGKPVSYSEATKKWTPPHGPPVNITCEYEKNGKTMRVPAYKLMRDIKTKKEMSPLTWIFVGSRTMEDGVYAADATGYLVSIVNFDLTVIDVPQLASSANETLEWESNPDLMPDKLAKVTMVIE